MKKNKEWSKKEVEEYLAILEYIDQLDEPEKVVIPQFVAETIEKYKENDNSLGELLASVEHANIKYYHGMEKHRVNFDNLYEPVVDLCAIIASAWLYGYAVEQPKLLTVIVKDYDRTIMSKQMPEDEVEKMMKGMTND